MKRGFIEIRVETTDYISSIFPIHSYTTKTIPVVLVGEKGDFYYVESENKPTIGNNVSIYKVKKNDFIERKTK